MHSAGLPKTLVKLLLSTRLLRSDLILCRPLNPCRRWKLSRQSWYNMATKVLTISSNHYDEELRTLLDVVWEEDMNQKWCVDQRKWRNLDGDDGDWD